MERIPTRPCGQSQKSASGDYSMSLSLTHPCEATGTQGLGSTHSLMAPPAPEPSATSFQGAQTLVCDGNGGYTSDKLGQTWSKEEVSAGCQGERAEGGSLLMPSLQDELVLLSRGSSSCAWSHRAVKTPCFCSGRVGCPVLPPQTSHPLLHTTPLS